MAADGKRRCKNILKGRIRMNKIVSSAITGAVVTAAVGTAAYMMNGKSPAKKRRQMKKNAVKAMQTVGGIVDGITSAIR